MAITLDGTTGITTPDVNVTAQSSNIVTTGNITAVDATLSGGVYVGGTAAANHLDDYEEGTWTPVYAAGGISGTAIGYEGTYTKIGNKVTIFFQAFNSAGDIQVSPYVQFTGCPFTHSKVGTSTVITEDIDIFSRQGFCEAGTALALSACGSSTGTTAIKCSVTYFTS